MSALLTRLGATQTAKPQAFGNYDELDATAQQHAYEQCQQAISEIDQLQDGMVRLFATADAVDAVAPSTAEGRQMARVMLATTINTLVDDVEGIADQTAGLEAEGCEDTGLEAWKTIKEYAKTIIDAMVKAWDKFVAFIKKYFHKFFGDAENLRKNWAKVELDAEAKLDLVVDEKKRDFTRATDYYQIGSKVSNVAEFISVAKEGKKILDGNLKEMKDNAPELVKLEDIFSEGKLVSATELFGKFGCSDDVSDMKQTSKRDDFTNCTDEMIGRRAIFVNVLSKPSGADDHEGLRSFLSGFRVGVHTLTADQKEKDSISLEMVKAEDIRKLAEANINVADSLIAMLRGKELKAVQDAIAKQVKEIKGWAGKAPKDDAPAEERQAFRTAIKLGTDYANFARRMGVDSVMSLTNYSKNVSNAHLVYARACLSNLKKA